MSREDYNATLAVLAPKSAESEGVIRLSRIDVQFVLRMLIVPPELLEKLRANAGSPVELTLAEARVVGDAATLRLAQIGFDEDYELTAEGRELETLISALVVP